MMHFIYFVGTITLGLTILTSQYILYSGYYYPFLSHLGMLLQIFVSRDGGNKKYSSVLAPGHHEGLK
jgi:hypothetical protein